MYGTVGYAAGARAEGNVATSTTATTGSGKTKHFHDAYPADGGTPGSTAATGAACYRGFREGMPI